MTPLDTLERLCAAAYDVREDNRRLVGIDAPRLRELIAELRRLRAAIVDWRTTHDTLAKIHFAYVRNPHNYESLDNAQEAATKARAALERIAKELTTPEPEGREG